MNFNEVLDAEEIIQQRRQEALHHFERKYLAIEVEVKAGEFVEVKLPQPMGPPVRIDRIMFAEGWHDGLLVNLTVGRRKLSRIPAARFLQGLELGWKAELGEELSLTIVNIRRDTYLALGCVDYTA